MSTDSEPSLDFDFPILIEYLAPEPSDRPRLRVVDNSLQPSKANVAAFWAKVVKSPTCWYWVGAISAPEESGFSTSNA
ncbi:hypothetical protein AAI421_28320 (plasmid) [Rhodococcus aetherivorans]|uniref:hypothetical protein n=1 Tax=Rhodococcus aetherivorans TaxID=191292 RepID=UPI0031DC70D2